MPYRSLEKCNKWRTLRNELEAQLQDMKWVLQEEGPGRGPKKHFVLEKQFQELYNDFGEIVDLVENIIYPDEILFCWGTEKEERHYCS